MNKSIIAPVEPLSADGLAVEQQLMARVLSSPLSSSSHLSSDNPASAGTSMNSGSHTQVHPTNGPGKKGSAAQRTARLKAEQTRVAQAALRAFIASVPVPRFDTAVLMDLEDMEEFDRHHDMRDANDVCLEADGDGSDAVSMESSALEAPSECYSQSNSQSNSSTQQSQALVSGVKEVRISTGITGPRSNGDGNGGCGMENEDEEEEEEEDNEGEEDLGLSPEQYLYVVAALCQVCCVWSGLVWSGLCFYL